MSNDNIKIEQFKKQVFNLATDHEVSTTKLTSNIINYILEISNIKITKNDEHPDSVCHADCHSDGGHRDSHSDTHPDCRSRDLLGEGEE